ncbi:MAG: hypothetical protein LAT81_00210 [Oceanicaulis sp.]|nr:hypothetical protein [Oceanicaulis sp.]
MKQTGPSEDRPESSASRKEDADARRARATGKTRGPKGVAPEIARQIDENLKRLYQQQVEQELPPELQALVARLKSGDVPGGPGGKDGA